VTYKRFDVVVVPFPFTDSAAAKRRPALVLSDEAIFNTPAGHSVMAMVTSAGNASYRARANRNNDVAVENTSLVSGSVRDRAGGTLCSAK